MSNRLSDRCPGRAQKHTPLARLSSTSSPFAGRLVGRMQYAPTFPEKDKVSLGMCFLVSRTMADKSVFHFSISNRLSDRDPCRGVLNTPHIDSTSTRSPFAGRLVRRMQYAPTLPEKEEASSGKCFLSSQTMGDQSVFHSSISNRLSDRYPCRAQKHTPHNHSRKGYLIARQTIVGRMQYDPTFPEKDKVSSDMRLPLSRTMADKYVFHFTMSNRLSDRYPGRGVLHTPLARLSSTPAPFAGRLVRRMQYAPTMPAEKSDLKGWRGGMFGTMVDKYVFLFFMSNWLSDRCPCRGVLNTPPARLSSTLSPLSGRLVRRMQYAPTLPEKDEGSSGR